MNKSRSLTGSSCICCEKVDVKEMVQCDVCDGWAHFTCVGVGSEIELPWLCSSCRIKSIDLPQTEAPAFKVDACVGTETNKESSSLVNQKCTADISIEPNINDQVFDLSDQKEPHERVPVSEEAFEGWDKLLKNRQTNASMKSLYLAINLKDMKPFLKECIVKTFAKPLIQKIHFEPGNSFNESNILSCLIDRSYYQTQSPASSISLKGPRNSSSPSASECSHGDSSKSVSAEKLNLIGNSPVALLDMETDEVRPYLEIIEQPIDKFRFRYKSEMHGTHGCLKNKVEKSFPTVKLKNFHGEAIIRCSLFQVDKLNNFHHSHSLVMRKDNEDIKDPHDVDVSPANDYTAIFVGMGIIRTEKKFIIDELHNKLVHRLMFEKGREITQLENEQRRTRAEKEAKNMNMNRVCLCFEAFLKVGDKCVRICKPVLSNAINDEKSVSTCELKITRLSKNISEAGGDEEVFLFVEKVAKKNIKVRFFEVDENDEPIWEEWGRFSEVDVHHQYAIALRTPPYRDKDIEEQVNCFIQLVRPSDQYVSVARPFRYKPSRTVVSRKRARVNTPYSSAELPATLNEVQTISVEYNKSALIADITNSNTDISQENLDSLLKYFSDNYTSDDLDPLFDIDELLEISKESETLGTENLLKTDSTGVSNTKESSIQFGPELLLPLMHKIILRNSTDSAAEKIRSLFSCEYENNRFNLHFLVTYNPEIFKHFLTYVEKLGIADVLDYQNDRKKSCFHVVCENYTPETIMDILPTLIRLGANPNLTDDKGDTVLHVLIREDKLNECADVLIKAKYPNNRKLDLEIENDDSFTPLLLASRLNRVEIVRLLLRAGASVDGIYKKDGSNILHIAVSEGSEELVALILNQTAIDVTQRNNANQIPIDLAAGIRPPNRQILDLLNRKCTQELQLESQMGETSSDDSDEKTSISSEADIDCERFERLLSFVTNTSPIEIKDVPYDDDSAFSVIMTTEKEDAFFNDKDDIIDDICLDQLCHWFNRSDKWKKLARCMDLEAFVNEWAASTNPSKMLFKFSEVQGTTLEQIIDIFKQLNESKALLYIDEMKARNLEVDE